MRTLVLLLLLSTSACTSPTEAHYQVPVVADEIAIPEIYAEWWVEVQLDAGISRDMSRVRLFSVPRPWVSRRYGRTVHGLWVPDGRIYIVEYLLLSEGIVKHELLHELLRGDATHAHPLFTLYADPLYGLPDDD